MDTLLALAQCPQQEVRFMCGRPCVEDNPHPTIIDHCLVIDCCLADFFTSLVGTHTPTLLTLGLHTHQVQDAGFKQLQAQGILENTSLNAVPWVWTLTWWALEIAMWQQP